MLEESVGRSSDSGERQAGSLGDVEQRVSGVGEVENPQHGELALALVLPAAGRPVQAPTTELRLAVRIEVHVGRVVLDHGKGVEHVLERIGQALGADEVEVVRGRVVLGVATPRRAHKAPTGRSNPGEQYWRSS